MKKVFLFSLALLGSSFAYGQKVDLDRFSFSVRYQKLPNEPVPFDARTYGVKIKVQGTPRTLVSEENLYDRIFIDGWKKVEKDPTVGIELSLTNFEEGVSKMETRTESTTNKTTKVVTTTNYYSIVVNYSAAGIAKIAGPITPKPLSERELADKKKKEEAVASNRFLKNATVAPREETGPEQFKMSVGGPLVGKTEEFKEAKFASEYFENNRRSMYEAKMKEFIDGSVRSVNGYTNRVYGYSPLRDTESLWIMDAKDDEGKTQIEAIEAVKALFAEMKPDEPIDDLLGKLEPLIDYFESLKTKYPSSEKGHKKIRYSSFYNLAKIYLVTDQPEKAIKQAEGLIANDYDAKDGKNLIETAEDLINQFRKAGTRSRHNLPLR